MNQSNGRIIGIDLGTTNSVAAHIDDTGRPVVVPDSDGNPLTPSVVFFDDDGVMVGRDARWYGQSDPTRMVAEVKRHMGDRKFSFGYRGRNLPAEAVSAIILKKLKQEAEARIGPIAGAVIAVPFYFDHTRRKATEDAGRIAGLDVLDIVNEPVAATLCHAYGRRQVGDAAPLDGDQPSRRVLVYDLGGGTFDVAYVAYDARRFRVVATDGDVRLGGTDWTGRLLYFVAEEYLARHAYDLRQDLSLRQRLIHECEEAKHALSKRPRVTLPVGQDSKRMDVDITREKFEELTADLLLRTEATTCDVLEAAKSDWLELDEVILVGGASRMPMVPSMFERLAGWRPNATLPPGEAVALGAAIHATIVEQQAGTAPPSRPGPIGSVEEINVNAHSLGISLLDRATGRDRTSVMIPRNTALPHRVTRRFRTVSDGQRSALVEVLEGEAPEPEACVPIGQCRLDQLPEGLPAGSSIEVTYSYEANGRVRITARDPVGGRFAETEIFLSAGLSPTEIESLREFVAALPVM
jgi:molecular chaperone DnaK